MVSVSLTALALSNFDLHRAVIGKRTMNVLCLGHGGGTLPLFLASKVKGATVHIVEIDPVVISASIEAMGFPASAVKETSEHFSTRPADADQLLYADICERLFLYRSDAEDFVLSSQEVYDLVFVDAYDGDDIFPHKLWDLHGPFLRSLRNRLYPAYDVVVNLNSDSEVFDHPEVTNSSHCQSILPMGKYVSQVCRAYKENAGMSSPFLSLGFVTSLLLPVMV